MVKEGLEGENAHRAHNLLESVTARTKRDHWVLVLPRHRCYTVPSHNGIDRLVS